MDRTSKMKVEPGRVAIHWLGQGGFAFKSHGGDMIYVDPYLSDSANADGASPRMADIPIKPKDVRLNYLFLTHDHADHTDPRSAPVIAQVNSGATIVCPPSSARHMIKLGVPSIQIMTAMPGQTITFPHFTVHAVAARHTEDSLGFVFNFSHGDATDGPIVYLVGDGEYHDGLSAAVADYGPDVLLVPIYGKGGEMTVEQAVKLTLEIEPREVVPMHYGMFESNMADPDEFVALLASELAQRTDLDIVPVVMKHNACHIFCPAEAVQGRQARKHARAERAREARLSNEHHDGARGPDGGANYGAGKARQASGRR